jgi:hypothetical protein
VFDKSMISAFYVGRSVVVGGTTTDMVAATFAPAPDCSKPHSAALVARGFVHGRLSDAGPPAQARPALAGIRYPSPSRP